MADEDADESEKTEEPTGKRLTDAKRKGNIAKSQEVSSWAVLLGMTFSLLFLAPWFMRNIANINYKFFQNPDAIALDEDGFRNLFMTTVMDVGAVLSPILALFFVIAIVAMAAQVGLTFSWEKMELKWNAFSPIAGAKRMVSLKQVVEFIKGILKVAIVGATGGFLAVPMLDDISLLFNYDLFAILDKIQDIALVLVAATVLIMTPVAVLDYLYQRYEHIKKLKMTKQEVKDEHKQLEGDPIVKQRLAQIRAERQRQRMMAAMGKADVIITNPTHYAVALQYDMDTMPAPVMIAKGVDDLAKRIREKGEELDIPIVENPPLARALYAAVELDEEIPPEHYNAVAEIIGYVYRLKGRMPTVNQVPEPAQPATQPDLDPDLGPGLKPDLGPDLGQSAGPPMNEN